jgi:hypothetical protein
MNGWSIGWREIFFIVTRLHKGGHAIVERCHKLVWFTRQHREGLLPMIGLRVLPKFSDCSHTKRVLSGDGEFVLWFLSVLLDCLPFVDRIAWKNAAPRLKGVLPEFGVLNPFGACVKEEPVGQFERPTHQLDLPFPVLIGVDHGLHRLRSQIVTLVE